MSAEHIPVLADTINKMIGLPVDAVAVDCTAGYGGHSKILADKLGAGGILVAFDVDKKCLETARENLGGCKCRVLLKNNNFTEISSVLKSEEIFQVNFILADLGWCSGQVTDSEKGFSFQENQPLDMRLDRSIKQNAADIVNTTNQSELADLIYKYGQERASRRIARFIAEYRRNQPIKSTGQLSFIVCKALGKQPGHKGLHPATRTFQALRIAVNSELENLEKLLADAPAVLKPGGKIAIISFHSLEDRIVKQDFQQKNKSDIYKLITKKPITPEQNEIRQNPRSRSAKLRIAERI